MVFHSGPNYDYPSFIKKLAKEFEEEFNCLGKITEKWKIFSVLKTKEVLIKTEDKLEKPDVRNYNLLTVQDLWQAHNQNHDNKKYETCGIN